MTTKRYLQEELEYPISESTTTGNAKALVKAVRSNNNNCA